MKKDIVVLEGDGIGPEIVTEAVKVLKAVAEKHGHDFEFTYAPFGAASWKNEGHPFPDKTKEMCDHADAIVKGPVGDPEVNKLIKDPKDTPEIGGILALRKRYDLYANYRPVMLPPSLGDSSPLRPEIIKDGINILMIRELTGGIYFGKKIEESQNEEGKYALDECVYTEKQVERIARIAFREAKKRNATLTNIHKSNVLATSRFWNRIVGRIAGEFPDVKSEGCLVDAAAYYLVKDPTRFNGIMLLENMQGDILTDQGGGILGSLGLMPSACINPETRKACYEPSHGSAPDIAGKGIANPYSQIGSMAMMLDTSFELGKEAEEVWTALHRVFAEGYRTSELVSGTEKSISTSGFGDLVMKYIKEEA